jgi:hypothetical protein
VPTSPLRIVTPLMLVKPVASVLAALEVVGNVSPAVALRTSMSQSSVPITYKDATTLIRVPAASLAMSVLEYAPPSAEPSNTVTAASHEKSVAGYPVDLRPKISSPSL